MTVRTPEGAWVVPTIAVCGSLPARVTRSRCPGSGVAADALPRAAAQPLVARNPRVIGISPLFRELILRIVELDSLNLRNPGTRASRVGPARSSSRDAIRRGPSAVAARRASEANCRDAAEAALRHSVARRSVQGRGRQQAHHRAPVQNRNRHSASANGVSNSGSATRCGCWPPATRSRRSRWTSATTASAHSSPPFA